MSSPLSRTENGAATAAPSVIELDHLEVTLGGRRVLDDLSGALGGRSIGLLGPNGAGKTTLVNTLLGFHRPSRGTARVLGHDVRGDLNAIRALVGYMPESDSFIAGVSGIRFVTLMAELAGLPPEQALERAHEALFFVGLGEARYRPMETYSLGMKQLAKLAQAIVHNPRLLFLDEPTNGLDPPARSRMIRLIRDIQKLGETQVMLSSHLLRDVEECCEEVLVLKDGRIAVYANLESERRANKKFLDLDLRGGEEPAKLFLDDATHLGCEWAPGPRGSTRMVLPEGVEVRDLFVAADKRQVQIRRLAFKRDSLEDIFLKAMEELPDGAPSQMPPTESAEVENGRA